MKFFLDSANLSEIEKAKDLPYFAGVTTNPLLICKENTKDREKFYEEVLSMIPKKELFVQVFSKEPEKIYQEGIILSNLSRERVIIKIPVGNEMIKAAKSLSDKGVRVCLTAISSIRQIAIAGILNIEYCAVYLNRMLKEGKDAYKQIIDSDRMITENSFKTRILVASLPDENLIEPLLSLKSLDYTLPFEPFKNIIRTEISEEWVRGFYEVIYKDTSKR